MALNPYDLFDVRSLLSEEERAVQDAVARFTDERVRPIIGDAWTRSMCARTSSSRIDRCERGLVLDA